MATNSTPHLTSDHNHAIDSPPTNLMTSISELRNLSTALSTFIRRYDELQQHMDFIQTTIDSKIPHHSAIPPLINAQTFPPNSPISLPTTKNSNKSPNSDQNRNLANMPSTEKAAALTSNCEHSELPKCEERTDIGAPLVDSELNTDTKLPNSEQNPDVAAPSVDLETKIDAKFSNSEENNVSEIEHICLEMCKNRLRKYLLTHLLDANKLRNEVPKALKCAPNPAKLVLGSFGKFYLQGKRAYEKEDSPMLSSREASILSLECFLLMESNDGVIENGVKEEGQSAAIAWRNRLRVEGGLRKACEPDARGLLFLISCFGIPKVFDIEDITDLVQSCNMKKIAGALRRSHIFLPKVPDIIKRMLKNKKEVQAVDMVYTFEVQDSFPPQTILTSLFSKSNEISKRKRTADKNLISILSEKKLRLSDLKYLLKCLENHKIDHSKSFPELKINETVSSLEKEIADIDKKVSDDIMTKRKEKEAESSKRSKLEDERRLRFPGHDPELQNSIGWPAGRSSHELQMNLNGGLPGHNSYGASLSALHGSGVGMLHEYAGSVSGAGLLHEYATSARVGSGGGVIAAETEGAFLSRDPYAASYRSMVTDAGPYNGQFYGWRGDAAANERFLSQTFAGTPSYAGSSGLYRPSPAALEGFAGLPDHKSPSISNRGPAADLYQFADSVLESELHRNVASRSGVNSRSGQPSRHR